MPRVFISMGSNIDRERNIRAGVHALRKHFDELTLSRVYESDAVGFVGHRFYNLVVAFDMQRSLEELRAILAKIEQQQGRIRRDKKFDNRSLDLDILLYGDEVRHEDGLNIPRSDINRYAFVLKPLTQIAGELKHPETGQRFDHLWQQFDDADQTLWEVDLGNL
ncbi:MAG TPA: 2-amino-4-hydroxy-6-hydroxymethyldihydropteridine diphosphokinase [Acidiferrobacteraceae bacterium]|nr:2-amino-4-hydroxy-6-hydroxymethyldihydropteridine diphosphokinase [Acidiferrobacteraceae bacterium]